MKLQTIRVFLALGAVLLVLPAAASAGTLTVTQTADSFDSEATTTGDCSLREAISAANTDGTWGGCNFGSNDDQDTINLVAGATYGRTQVDTVQEQVNQTGDYDVRFEGLTINGNGATIDAGGLSDKADNRVISVSDSTAGLTLRDATLIGGRVGHNNGGGGALRVDGDAVANLFDVTITNNRGRDGAMITPDNSGGGAIAISGSGSVLGLFDVTISDNSTDGDGGAIWALNGSSATLNNVTVANNTADFDSDSNSEGGGGVALDGGGTIVGFANTLIAGNLDTTGTGAFGPNCLATNSATPISYGYNLMSDATGCAGLVVGTGDQYPPGPVAGLDTALASNGGTTQTLKLLPNSTAINAGNPAAPAALAFPKCTPTSQNGVTRPAGAACDIGAYEVPPAATGGGTTTAPGNPTSSTNPAGKTRKRKCKKKKRAAAAKKCKKKKK